MSWLIFLGGALLGIVIGGVVAYVWVASVSASGMRR